MLNSAAAFPDSQMADVPVLKRDMDFKTKSYLTLTRQRSGILGAEMYVLPQGLEAYGRAIHNPAYYPAEADKDNWQACAREIIKYVPKGTPTMEYGPGDYETTQKTGKVVKALNSARYVGVDLSKSSLNQALRAIIAIKSDIEAVGLEHDFWSEDFPISDKPTLAFIAGGSIGNFEVPILKSPPHRKLTDVLSTLVDRTNGGWLLVSADMLQSDRSPQFYENAYAGPEHAVFNLSVFHRMRQELGINIDPDGFDYKPEFNPASGAVQHMAYANKPQIIDFNGTKIDVKKGDAFHLQNSFRFTESFFNQCVADAGLVAEKVWKHPVATMSLHLLRKNNTIIPLKKRPYKNF